MPVWQRVRGSWLMHRKILQQLVSISSYSHFWQVSYMRWSPRSAAWRRSPLQLSIWLYGLWKGGASEEADSPFRQILTINLTFNLTLRYLNPPQSTSDCKAKSQYFGTRSCIFPWSIPRDFKGFEHYRGRRFEKCSDFGELCAIKVDRDGNLAPHPKQKLAYIARCDMSLCE